MKDYKNCIANNIFYLRRYARALTNNNALADIIVKHCVDCAMDLRPFLKQDHGDTTALKLWLFSILQNIYAEVTAEHYALAARFNESTVAGCGSEVEPQNDTYLCALMELPLLHKQIFLLVSVEKFTYEEVSEIVNLPLGAVVSLLHTARHEIAEKVYSNPAPGAEPSLAEEPSTGQGEALEAVS